MVNPLITVLSIISIISKKKIQVPDSFGLLLLFMVFQGVFVSFLTGFEVRYFASHLFVALFSLVIYYDFYSSDFSESQLEQYIKVFVYLTLVINAIGIVVYLWGGFSTGRVQYLGYACEGMLVCLAYFLINRKLLGVLLTIIIVLASGKRGVYLGVLVVTALYFLRYSSKKNSIKYFSCYDRCFFFVYRSYVYI